MHRPRVDQRNIDGIAGMPTGAALSRSQTAPPNALLDPPYPTPVTPTILSTLASIASAEEVGNDPSSPASATTAHQLQKKRSADAREAQSTQSAPCLGGLGKRRASESNISVNMDAKRSRPRLAHVEAAIKQVRLCSASIVSDLMRVGASVKQVCLGCLC